MERRRSPRIPARMQFDVYRRECLMGRFRARDVSQGGVFLETEATDCSCNGILELCFRAGGREHRIRGVVVRTVQGQGFGVELAFWRPDDRSAYAAYLDACACRGQSLVPRQDEVGTDSPVGPLKRFAALGEYRENGAPCNAPVGSKFGKRG